MGKKNRLLRMMHLLRRIHSSPLSVTHRRNRLAVFIDGYQFFQSLYAAVRRAEHFILIEYYMIRNDETGAALAALLAEAVRRGLRWFDRRDHRKMVIIDGSLAFLGGFNISDEYSGLAKSPRRFHDVGFSISGSAVRELVGIFSETWLMERGELPQLFLPGGDENSDLIRYGQGNVTIVSGGPLNRLSHIHSAFLFNIAAASEKILIATPYFIPGPRIVRSLLRAAGRGVRVRLLLQARSDIPIVRLVGRSYYSVLLQKGIEISEMEHEILHAKVMLIDGKQAVIGSANLDQRSFHRNFEINLIVDDEAFGTQIQTKLLEDFANSRQIILVDHERRGLIARALEKMINLFGWFL